MNKISEPMTYARLEEILTGLGFVKKATDEFIAFLHEGSENILVLPHIEADAKISNWHLMSTEKVVSASTSVSMKTLQRMLARHGVSRSTVACEILKEKEPDLAAIQ